MADFWRDEAGDVVIRLSSTRQHHSYRCRMKSGAQVSEAMLPALEDYVSELLVVWSSDCLDEPPWIDE